MADSKFSWGSVVRQFINVFLSAVGIFLVFSLCAFSGCLRVNGVEVKDAEVKQNVHSIQLALERYAVDAPDNRYPLFLSGGDWTDSYVVWEEWFAYQQLDPSQIEDETRQAGWQPAPPSMGDSLVMEAYMPAYPGNPFVQDRRRHKKPQTIVHHPHPEYGSPYERTVGGSGYTKMYEVFGPIMLQKGSALAGDYYVHHIYNDPPYDVWGDIYKTPANGWGKASGNEILVGNFSYYPRTKESQSWPLLGLALTEDSEPLMVIGYSLAGYGKLKTAGQDVYNRNGEYELHCRTETRESYFGDAPLFPDAIPFLADGAEPTVEANNGGPDGIPDGVVIVLDSGVERKRPRSHYGPD